MILTTLYSFSSNIFSSPDGYKPIGNLLIDSDGNLYGSTGSGGSKDSYGTEYVLMRDGTGYAPGLSNLVTFDSYATGYMPSVGMISDAAGNLFGVSDQTVFELARVGDHYAATRTILARTESEVRGGLVMDAAGNLFGTTSGGNFGNGTVFEIAKTANGYASTATTLVTFNNTNGWIPSDDLIMDAQGNLFGTTILGGTNGYGTVFEIVKTANGYASAPTVLYNFDKTHGSQPSGSLRMDSAGNLFGTTAVGGAYGKGTVFEIEKTASGYASTPTIIASFNGINGSSPAYQLMMDGLGNLYGVTRNGGVADKGTVFAILKDGNGYSSTISTLWEFNGSNGANPSSGLVMDSWGHIFGTTYTGGANGGGTIFELSMVAPLTASISGTAQQGQTLTASADGAVTGYQWQELVGGVWTDLYGETGATYAVKATDAGRQIRVEAFGSDGRLGISRATDSVLDAAGNQLVYENALQTTLGSGLLQSVYGYAANATIASGGQQNVYAGGRADQTIVNAGGAQIDWGMLAHTTLNGGSQYVYGTSDATVINSGLQVIESGGAASATIIRGGEQDVVDGGSATGTTVNDGIQVVYGTVSQTVLIRGSSGSNPIQHLHGIATATSLYGGGQQNVYADGTAIGTRVAGGSQFVWGTSTGGSVEAGKQYVYGTVTDTKIVNAGARQDVQAGGHAVNDTLAGSGVVWVHAGGSLDGLVSLTGSFNQLVIEDSSSFNATISAWQPNKNTIDLLDIHFAAGSTSLAYAQNSDNTGGTLTVTDGTHTASLHLLGQYSAANFQLSADNGLGGTLITEVVAPAQTQLAAALAS